MLNFYQQLTEVLKQTPVVLATVSSVQGSVPREVGAKMFIYGEGRTFGTIGGGAGEAKVCQQALEVLQTGKKQFVEIDLSGSPNRQTQGVCGGMMLVWLELWLGSDRLNLVNQIIDILTSGGCGALVTPFDVVEKPHLQTIDVPTFPLLKNNALVEPLITPPTLLIIGAGHIAVSLAQIGKIIGFQVIVQDERPDFANRERFPEASVLLAEPIAIIQEILNKRPNLYVTLVTRGYQQDLDALRLLWYRKLQYVGMVGSKKRVQTVYKMLQDEGYSPGFIKQIHAPVGLNIGALTPEEIAVSICAELIQVRRGESIK
jgi:xanthine dehydrogenase accessory factor